MTGGDEEYCHHVGEELARRHRVDTIAKRTQGASTDKATPGSMVGRVAFVTRAAGQLLRNRADVLVGTNYVTIPAVWLVGRITRRPVVYW